MSFMTVTIFYGFEEVFSVQVHRMQRVTEVRDRLTKSGYRVYIHPVDALEVFVIEMCGHEVFRCNIKFLGFNTPYQFDTVCQRAITACISANKKFLQARSYLWLWMLIDSAIFRKNEVEPPDYWPITYTYGSKPFDVIQCANCCGILLSKKPIEEKDETPPTFKLLTDSLDTAKKTKTVKRVKV